MRVLLVEPHPDGLLDIAMRAKAASHTVFYYCHDYDQWKHPVGRGLVERVPDWRSVARNVDMIVLGAGDYCMHQFDALRQQTGVPIIGGGVESASWEGDRLKGMSMFKKAGIPTPPVREFTDYAAAIKYVEQTGQAYACKPCWDGADKSLSYVGKSPEDMIYMLDRWRRKGPPKGTFVMQTKVSGVEVGVGAWHGRDGFAGGWEENFECKKLFPGDLGPTTGEMGTVMRYVQRSKLADKVLRPLEGLLDRLGYVGNIDVNCIIDEDGTPWPLEFTMRCGWPSTNIEMELFDVDPVEFWYGLACGSAPRKHHRMNEVAIGVVLAIPDFPYSHATAKETVGIPIYGMTPSVEEHWHPAQMQIVDKQLQTAGDYVGIMVGLGGTVREAQRRAYARLKKIELPSSPFYRTDIGERLRKQLPELQAHGYAAGLDYA